MYSLPYDWFTGPAPKYLGYKSNPATLYHTTSEPVASLVAGFEEDEHRDSSLYSHSSCVTSFYSLLEHLSLFQFLKKTKNNTYANLLKLDFSECIFYTMNYFN